MAGRSSIDTRSQQPLGIVCVDFNRSGELVSGATPAPGYLIQPGAAACKCSACAEFFESTADLRAHWKSDRHIYNMRHRDENFKPVTKEEWDADTSGRSQVSKDSNVVKPLRRVRAGREHVARLAPPEISCSADEADCARRSEQERPDKPWACLFDRQSFDTVEECLAYMETTYSFFAPQQEDLQDLPGLIRFLMSKVTQPPHACICCNRPFPSLASVRRHMLDKNHTHIGTETFSRRGNYDVLGSWSIRSEIRPYYKRTDPAARSEARIEREHLGECSGLLCNGGAADCDRSDSEGSIREESEVGLSLDEDCEDDSEFERMLRIVDLQCISPDLSNSGNLLLPCGATVGARERQRVHRRQSGLYRRGRQPTVKELLRSGHADAGELQVACDRSQAMRAQWVGVASASKARQEYAPRLKKTVEGKSLFDGGYKTNFERGEGCRGQGKRHQNAAVHEQPKKSQGKLAKWSKRTKPQPNSTSLA